MKDRFHAAELAQSTLKCLSGFWTNIGSAAIAAGSVSVSARGRE